MFRRKRRVVISPIMKSIQDADLNAVKDYFNDSARLFEINSHTSAGVTLLHWTVLKTKFGTTQVMLPVIQYLLDLGADQRIPEAGTNKSTPLISAARRALPKVVAILLEDEKCDVAFEDARSKTALDYVLKRLANTHQRERFEEVRGLLISVKVSLGCS